MSFFSSKREQRLWQWSAIALAGIYLSLPLAASLATFLYNQNMAAAAFLFCMFLVGVAILVLGIRARPSGLEIGIGIGLVAVYLMVLFRLTLPERSHLIEYSVVAALIYEAFSERAKSKRIFLWPSVLAICVTSAAGAFDEFIQYFLPMRHFDWMDIVFNCLASFMAVVSIAILRWVRDFVKRSKT